MVPSGIQIITNPENIVVGSFGDFFYRKGEECILISGRDNSWRRLNFTTKNFYGIYAHPIYKKRAISTVYYEETWTKMDLTDDTNVGWSFVAPTSPLVDAAHFGDPTPTPTPAVSPQPTPPATPISSPTPTATPTVTPTPSRQIAVATLLYRSASPTADLSGSTYAEVVKGGRTDLENLTGLGTHYGWMLRNDSNAPMTVNSVSYPSGSDMYVVHGFVSASLFPTIIPAWGNIEAISTVTGSDACRTLESIRFDTDSTSGVFSYDVGMLWNYNTTTDTFGQISWASPYSWIISPIGVVDDTVNDLFSWAYTGSSYFDRFDLEMVQLRYDGGTDIIRTGITGSAEGVFGVTIPSKTVKSVIAYPVGVGIETDQGNQASGVVSIVRSSKCDVDPILFAQYKDPSYAVLNYIYASGTIARDPDMNVSDHWEVNFKLTNIGTSPLTITNVAVTKQGDDTSPDTVIDVDPLGSSTIQPHDNAEFQIRFTNPSGPTGTTSALLTIQSNNQGGDVVIGFNLRWAVPVVNLCSEPTVSAPYYHSYNRAFVESGSININGISPAYEVRMSDNGMWLRVTDQYSNPAVSKFIRVDSGSMYGSMDDTNYTTYDINIPSGYVFNRGSNSINIDLVKMIARNGNAVARLVTASAGAIGIASEVASALWLNGPTNPPIVSGGFYFSQINSEGTFTYGQSYDSVNSVWNAIKYDIASGTDEIVRHDISSDSYFLSWTGFRCGNSRGDVALVNVDDNNSGDTYTMVCVKDTPTSPWRDSYTLDSNDPDGPYTYGLPVAITCDGTKAVGATGAGGTSGYACYWDLTGSPDMGASPSGAFHAILLPQPADTATYGSASNATAISEDGTVIMGTTDRGYPVFWRIYNNFTVCELLGDYLFNLASGGPQLVHQSDPNVAYPTGTYNVISCTQIGYEGRWVASLGAREQPGINPVNLMYSIPSFALGQQSGGS